MIELPIDAHSSAIVGAVRERGALVLVAEPGAGKTTRVPRALLDAGIAERGEIVVLEPRRLATRLAARRVADELGEKVGARVGYQVRYENVSSARTRVRFVTEGILTARLASNPTLEGVSCVVLDELHERHLHGDVALAWMQRLRATARPDLALVAMSATLDADMVAERLHCDAMHVPGRRFEVAVEHLERPDDRPLEQQVLVALRRWLNQEGGRASGSVLVFLPGAGEIRRAREACDETARRAGMQVALLHGDLPPDEQDRAVRPGGPPKLILSTNVAETSVTIDGVVAVVDSGLARVARHSPWSGLPALELAKISQASAAQRAGRAGRTGPGRCLRLYTKHDHDTRPAHDVPEILRADLAEPLLALHALGVEDARELPWLDPPPAAALAAASSLLGRLGAIAGSPPRLTALGAQMRELSLHPRLARLVLAAAERGAGRPGCLLAAVAAERDPRMTMRTRLRDARGSATDEVGSSDLIARMQAFEAVADSPGGLTPDRIRAHDLDVGTTLAIDRARRALTSVLERRFERPGPPKHLDPEAVEEALLVATLAGFPDRVARRRTARADDIVFAGGGAAKLAPTSVVHEAELVVAVEAEERRGQPPLVRTASAVQAEWLLELFPDRIGDRATVRFDPANERVEATHAVVYDDLVLDESRATDAGADAIAAALAEAALARGARAFCDGDALDRLAARLAFAREHDPSLPALDDDAIRATLRELCAERRSFAELREAGLLDALRARFTPAQLAQLERLAPDRLALPGRKSAPIQYEPGKPPWLASRLQDFFGLRESPRIAGGRVPLVLHLLAPNQRAVQVTTDLAGFWTQHYPALRRQLMRRYPRHAWPETPG